MRLSEQEQNLYKMVAVYQQNVELMLLKFNERNANRVVEKHRRFKNEKGKKTTIAYGIFAVVAAVAAVIYKGLGLF